MFAKKTIRMKIEALWGNSPIKIILKQQDLSALKLTRNGQELLTTQEQVENLQGDHHVY